MNQPKNLNIYFNEYCNDCKLFEAEVNKMFFDNATEHVITCSHIQVCENLIKRMCKDEKNNI